MFEEHDGGAVRAEETDSRREQIQRPFYKTEWLGTSRMLIGGVGAVRSGLGVDSVRGF